MRASRKVSAVTMCRALRIASQLLCYPDDTLWERLPLLSRATATVGGEAQALLTTFIADMQQTGPGELARAYVDLFDLRRRCCLYLTYYSHGDTRKRGMALLRFAHAYKEAGFELVPDELPDHLAVVCEFTAAAPDEGLALLTEQRAGLELLHMALDDAQAPWLAVVDAVRAVLPEPAPKDMDLALALARSGPPAEEVGLEPFAPPEYMGGRR